MRKLSKKQRKTLRALGKIPQARKIQEHRHRITVVLRVDDGHLRTPVRRYRWSNYW